MTQQNKNALNALAKNVLADIIGSAFYALAIVQFAKNAAFAPGGVSGLSLIINHVTGWPIGIMTLLINVPIVFISYKVVGKRFLLRSARTMIFSSIMVDYIFPRLPAYHGDRLLAALFTGALMGVGLAIVFMRGSSTGGSDFLIMSIKKLAPHFSLGTLTLALDCVVILTGGIVYRDVDAMLYGVVATLVASVVIDKMMYGTGGGKLMMIVTTRAADVAAALAAHIDRGSTMVQGMGMYSGELREILYCACSNRQAVHVKNIANRVDPKAFVVVCEANELFGEGFQALQEDES